MRQQPPIVFLTVAALIIATSFFFAENIHQATMGGAVGGAVWTLGIIRWSSRRSVRLVATPTEKDATG